MKYPFSNSINGTLNFSMINPLSGDGLDNFSEDMIMNGFNSLQLGTNATKGTKKPLHHF